MPGFLKFGLILLLVVRLIALARFWGSPRGKPVTHDGETLHVPAIGIAAGSVFGAMMTLRWGHPLWLELLGWGLGVAATYLFIGWMIHLDEKKRRGSVRFG